MRVLIADKFEESGRKGFEAAGFEVAYQPALTEETLSGEVERLRPDVLVVRSTKVNEAALNAGALKLVVRAGAGYNTIDVAAASRRGIYVSNCPGKEFHCGSRAGFRADPGAGSPHRGQCGFTARGTGTRPNSRKRAGCSGASWD